MATPMKAETAHPSPSLVSSANKSQFEEKSRGGGESFKMQSSKDSLETQRSISSDGSQEQPLEVQINNNIDQKSWPMENIVNPGINDCLMGRGGGTNHHPGNKRYRAITEAKKPKYLASKRLEKPLVAMEVIKEWRALNPMGRFLKQHPETKLWYDVGDRKAREKTSQALREKMTYPLDDKNEGTREHVAGEQIPGAKQLMEAYDENKSACYASSPQQFKKGVWTEEEMQRVRDARKEFGNKWSDVAKRVPGRSEISVKNWWYNHQTSERRKRKRQDGEVNRRNLVAKYNNALILPQKNHPGQHNDNIDSFTSYTGEKDASPRTMIGSIPGAVASSCTGIMEGGTNGYKIVESSGSESGCEFGAVGHTFRRQLEDKNGRDLGWYVGTVVDVICGTDKDRRCLYYAIGFVEDLSMFDLKELAQLEEYQK